MLVINIISIKFYYILHKKYACLNHKYIYLFMPQSLSMRVNTLTVFHIISNTICTYLIFLHYKLQSNFLHYFIMYLIIKPDTCYINDGIMQLN